MPDPVRAEPEPGDIKDHQIGVRWRRVGDQYPGFGAVSPHCFDFDDRPWNVASGAPQAACGTPGLDGHVRVSHTYETSSWDKPANGPRVALENQIVPHIWDLESYQVKPHGEAGVVAIFMDNLLRGKQSTLNHFPEDKAGMIRDYCFVGDVVKANLCALESGSGDFFNIGTGRETKTLDLYKVIFKAFSNVGDGIREELAVPLLQEARPGDLSKSCLVAEKALKQLGWEPETGIEAGINRTLEWRLDQER